MTINRPGLYAINDFVAARRFSFCRHGVAGLPPGGGSHAQTCASLHPQQIRVCPTAALGVPTQERNLRERGIRLHSQVGRQEINATQRRRDEASGQPAKVEDLSCPHGGEFIQSLSWNVRLPFNLRIGSQSAPFGASR